MPSSENVKFRGNVLVVDDCSDGRHIIGRVLQCIGLTVATAEDGRAGCERALGAQESGTPFDLIIMDMHMPVMDGYAATAHLRKCNYTGRIAALTADATPGVREACLKAGCDDFANKPITFEMLVGLVQRNLPKRGGADQSSSSAGRSRTASMQKCA